MASLKARSSIAFSLHSKINFKIIVVGDRGVGKTSLIIKYVKGIFDKNYTVTVGVQFYSKMVQVDSEQVGIQLWDTAGQQNFKAIVRSFYQLASCVIIVYCHPAELGRTVQNFQQQIGQFANKAARIMLVRTKSDLIAVTEEERELAAEIIIKHKIDMFMQVSAAEERNVSEFFQGMSEKLLWHYRKDEQFRQMIEPKKNSFQLSEDPEEKQVGLKKRRICCT